MNREIKFRVFDEKLLPNKMYYWEIGNIEFELVTELKNNPSKVMQFTGLQDKNGKEIWEGDFVKVKDDYESVGFMAGEIREVIFKAGGFRLKPKIASAGCGHWLEDGNDFEIIGNVWENPELLGGAA